MRWNAIVICATCTTRWKRTRQHSRRDMARHFDAPSIFFGTLVEYIPTTAGDKSRVQQFGKRTLKGIFLGFVPRAGGGWSGDLMIAVCEDLRESETPEIYVKILAKEENELSLCKRNSLISTVIAACCRRHPFQGEERVCVLGSSYPLAPLTSPKIPN